VKQNAKAKALNFNRDLAKFTPRQREATRVAESGGVKFLLYGGALGGGKLLAISTVIPTPDGWTTMEDLKPGDQVYDEHGKVCNVDWVSEVQYETTYKLTFSDGSELVAGARHQWVTETMADIQASLRRSPEFRAQRRASRASRSTGKRPDLAVRNSEVASHYVSAPVVPSIKTTQEIKDTLYKGPQANHAVRVCGPLQLPKSELVVPPYTLGSWLGDGTSISGGLTGIDPQIFEEIEKDGYRVSHHKSEKSHYILGLVSKLKQIGVQGNKHIPMQYLRASVDQRLALLQGLMDTDGTCDTRGQCEITLTRKELVDGVRELILSLGIKVTACESRAKLNGIDYGPRWRMKFITNMPAFRLERKLARQKIDGFRGTHDRRYIVKVEEVDQVPLKCISVDAPSHMYLCGETMIPTHNSYLLRWFCVKKHMRLFMQGITGAVIMLACENYPALKDRQLSKISREFPDWLGKSHNDHKDYGRCFILAPEYGSGVIVFRNLDDPSKYASSEFAMIAVDELTKNDYDTFTHLRTRLRWPGLEDIDCQFIAGTNPGSIGHGWVKQLWMDKQFPSEWISPVDYRSQFAYIPSKADDNPHLPASYWQQLDTLPETLRKAFKDGDWNIFLGQAFPEFGPAHRVPNDTPIGETSPIYMTFDWGYGKPFSVLWSWLDGDGRIHVFDEYYGSTGEPDTGLRLTDSEIAEGIKAREERIGISKRNIIRILSPDCFSKKPDYKGGGQGKATAEVFRECGVQGYPGDADRVKKVRQFHDRLRIRADEPPMLRVYERCTNFIRTIPMLQQDERNIEDIDTDGEDHSFDSICFLLLARPISEGPRKPKEVKKEQNVTTVAWTELAEIRRKQDNLEDYADF